MPVVVVIDLQPHFAASCDKRLLANAERELRRARENNWPVMVVEYAGYGKTHDCLRNVLKGYKPKKVVTKSMDDGSNDIIGHCDQLEWPKEHFIVFGVNANACVRQTVDGLSGKLPLAKIEVIKDACNQDYQWKTFVPGPNVELVGV